MENAEDNLEERVNQKMAALAHNLRSIDDLRRSRETFMDFSPDQMRLFHGVFDLIDDLQKRVAKLERPRPDTKTNLLDPNGFIEAIIRRAADDGRADEIIDRLRGGP